MAINLKKGDQLDLNKSLKKVMVGLGWADAGKSDEEIDCDASVFLLNEEGKLLSKKANETVVYFKNLQDPSGAIVHQGDNLTGGDFGDSEQIMIDLQKVPANIYRIAFVVNIYDADKKGQHFGMISAAYIRLVNQDDDSEICRYNLSENYNNMTGLIAGVIYRDGNEWKFKAIGKALEKASRLDYIARLFM